MSSLVTHCQWMDASRQRSSAERLVLEGIDITDDRSGHTWQQLKMAGFVNVQDSPRSKSFKCHDFSLRSLESVNDPSCPSAPSWRRSFNPLDSFKTERESRLSSCPDKEDVTVGSTPTLETQPIMDLDSNISPKQHKKDSFLVEECSVSTPSCDSWQGLVTIGKGLCGHSSPASPESRASRKLRYIDISRTPPRPKKKKSEKKGKRRQSVRSSRKSPTSPVVPWGDLAIIHEFHQNMEEFESPGHTPKKTRRKKLSLNGGLAFGGYNASNDGIVGNWDELLIAAMPIDGSSHFETSMFNVGPLDSGYLLKADKPSSTAQTLHEALPFWTQGNDSFLDRFKTLYDSPENDDRSLRKDLFCSLNEENPVSANTPSEREVTSNDDVPDKQSQGRLIRFADEQGLPIEKIYQIGDMSHLGTMGRIIVLLVDPLVKKFEFLQGEYSTHAGTTVADLLRQLPSFAVEERFAKMEYDSLYGTNNGPRELKSTDRLDQLDLAKREITVAVARGVCGIELVHDAGPILRNDEINRAVKKAIRIGRGIKYIKSRMEMEVENQNRSETHVPLNELDLCHNDLILPENLELESTDIKDHQTTPTKGRFYPPPFIDLYDCNDHVPHLDDNSLFPDQRELVLYYETDHNPHRVIKFIHASLLATIGIAYSLTTK